MGNRYWDEKGRRGNTGKREAWPRGVQRSSWCDCPSDKGVTALYFRERGINIHEDPALCRAEKVEI